MVGDKEYSGSLLSQQTDGIRLQNCQAVSSGSKDKKNFPTRLPTSTGRSLLPSRKRARSLPSRDSSLAVTPNSQEAMLLLSMSGRKTPQSPTPGSNLASNQFEETQRLTGNKYGAPPSPARWRLSPPKFEFVIIGSYSQLQPIFNALSLWNDLATCFGDQPALENLEVPGHNILMLTLSVRGQNSGKY